MRLTTDKLKEFLTFLQTWEIAQLVKHNHVAAMLIINCFFFFLSFLNRLNKSLLNVSSLFSASNNDFPIVLASRLCFKLRSLTMPIFLPICSCIKLKIWMLLCTVNLKLNVSLNVDKYDMFLYVFFLQSFCFIFVTFFRKYEQITRKMLVIKAKILSQFQI